MENLPYQDHSETSKQAAEKKTDAKDDRRIILGMIKTAGVRGLTNDEISEFLGKDSSFYSPRLIELERLGDIFKLRQTRKTRKDRNANVYVTSLFIIGRPIIPVKKIGKMPDPMIEEADKRILSRFITDCRTFSKMDVPNNGVVYNAIKRLAGV